MASHKPQLRKLLYSVKETQAALSISHAGLYRLIAAGHFDVRKIGRKTVITAESLERFAAGLPKYNGGNK